MTPTLSTMHLLLYWCRAQPRDAGAQFQRVADLYPSSELQRVGQLHYKANDGQADSNVATVSITVSAVNDAPVAADETYSTDQGTPLTVAAPGVLGNDTDAEGIRSRHPRHWSQSWHNDAQHKRGLHLHTCTRLHRPGWFHLSASDGEAVSNFATVALTVRPVNTSPGCTLDDAYTTHKDQVLFVSAPGLLSNDTDADGDLLFVGAVDDSATIGGRGLVDQWGLRVRSGRFLRLLQPGQTVQTRSPTR